ncbi:3',5'-cyclic adenosine monophosphate phosphodiesterase CpdA [Chitinophaga sp. MM2321]
MRFIISGWLLATCFLQCEVHAQSLRPDRIVLNVTADPSRTAAVTWRTAQSITTSYAELAPATADPRFTAQATQYKAETTAPFADSLPVRYHHFTFSGLQPNTVYAYRVGQGEEWSEWFQFSTAGLPGEPFSFIYLGDAQANILSLWSRAIRKAWSSAPDARLIIHAGDLVHKGNNNNQWQQWFEAGSFIHSSIPGMMTPGNHEYYENTAGQDVPSVFWRPQFTLPENGPAGLEETVYYTDVQGMRFISLNSEEIRISDTLLARQQTWLEDVLKNNPNRWTCITFHHPVLSTSKKHDNTRLRENFKPLLDKYKVDLVLQGHDHTYARGRSGNTGPVYVVSVSGPKMTEISSQPWMARTGTYTQLYQIVDVKPKTISYRAYTVTGELFDAFELEKQANGENLLKNKMK